MTGPSQVFSLMVIIALGFLALAKRLFQTPRLILALSATSFFARRHGHLHTNRRRELRLPLGTDLGNPRLASTRGSQHYYLT